MTQIPAHVMETSPSATCCAVKDFNTFLHSLKIWHDISVCFNSTSLLCYYQSFTGDTFHLRLDGTFLPQATVVDLSGEAKTRPWTDRYPLAGWGILQGLTDWDLCTLFTAVVWTEGSLPECDEPLELMDAAESDGDQQPDPLLTDDAPEKTFGVFLYSNNYVVCLCFSGSQATGADQFQLLGRTWLIWSKIKFKNELDTFKGAGGCEEIDPNLMVGKWFVSQQVGSRRSLNFGCSWQPGGSGGWSAEVTWSCLVMLLQNTSGPEFLKQYFNMFWWTFICNKTLQFVKKKELINWALI